MRRILVGVAVALATASLSIGPAEAAPATPCTGTMSDTTVGRLVVPAGETCDLRNVVVNGNVRVWGGGALFTHDSTVNGSVHGLRARTVRIIGTDLVGTGTTGNITLTGTRGPVVIGSDGCAVDPVVGNNITLTNNHGTIAICFMTVDETITLHSNDKTIGAFHNTIGNPFVVQGNSATFIRLRDNEVGLTGGGSMVVQNNTTTGNAARPDGLRLLRNHSHNAFNCTGNDDAPIGSENTADNGMSGQCAGL